MRKSEILTLDLETYGHTTYSRFCNPLDPNHYVVAVCYKQGNQKARVVCDYDGIECSRIFSKIDLANIKLIIMQNGKFDMLWFWKNKEFQDFLKRGGIVWDTLLAEYLIRGQQGIAHFGKGRNSLSLDALSEKYGGTQKDIEVKDVFLYGGTVLDIPKDQLIKYGIEDVNNTELVFKGQVKKAKKLGILNLIKAYNDHLLAVTEMEFNGMYFDVEGAKSRAEQLELELTKLETDMHQLLNKAQIWPEIAGEFNLGSSAQLQTLLFGGTISYKVDATVMDLEGQPVRFKTGKRAGQIKTKKQEVEAWVDGLGEVCAPENISSAGNKATDDKTLKALKASCTNDLTPKVIDVILEYRALQKLISTYLFKDTGKTPKGLVPLIHPDGCLHTEYKITETVTGRLASNKPNMQNIPPAVTDLFVSRYSGGKIAELDFSQLEVMVQADITNCKKMLEDIQNGTDFHCLRLSYAEGRDYDEVVELCETDPEWKKKRKKAKIVSFQKAYGAMAKKIAASTGLSVETVELIFAKEDERYPEIKQYYDNMLEFVNAHTYEIDTPMRVRSNGQMFDHPHRKQIVGKFQTFTGKIYTFQKKAVMGKSGLFEYWPMPDIQNYPIQGTAADIVALQVGKVFRYMLKNREKGLMVNEIHDSVVLDIKSEYVDEITQEVKRILESTKETFKEKLDLDFDAPITADVGVGDNWREAK